eukprot:scaffold7786_cov85-Isochrysis_galbana.AAC.1
MGAGCARAPSRQPVSPRRASGASWSRPARRHDAAGGRAWCARPSRPRSGASRRLSQGRRQQELKKPGK